MSSARVAEALRSEVVRLLADNGYVELAPQVEIGDIYLEIPHLWEGPRENMDLSLIVDRPESRESALRLYWLVQRLARALDSSSSRRTVTVVAIGEPSNNSGLDELLELSRVLVVDGSLATDRMIGPLLRLRLPATATSQLDGIAEVAETISKNPSNRELLLFLEAAGAGANVVSDRYRAWIDESFISRRVSDG